jgi:hypothetical protein
MGMKVMHGIPMSISHIDDALFGCFSHSKLKSERSRRKNEKVFERPLSLSLLVFAIPSPHSLPSSDFLNFRLRVSLGESAFKSLHILRFERRTVFEHLFLFSQGIYKTTKERSRQTVS